MDGGAPLRFKQSGSLKVIRWDVGQWVVLALWVSGCGLLLGQDKPDEVALTPELLQSLEPKLSKPAELKQMRILDRLTHGHGRFLRVEGKSRKSLLLAMDASARQMVRLFDLSEFDLKDSKLAGTYHFNGILSKLERIKDGTIEAWVTHARLSSGPGTPYSSGAQEFFQRVQEFEQRNQDIRGASAEQVPSVESPKQEPAQSAQVPAAVQPKPEPASSSAASADTAAQSAQSEKEIEEEPRPRSRPVLMRRDRKGSQAPGEGSRREPTGDSSASTTAPPASEDQGAIQMPDDQDVVIYRRKPRVGGSESAPVAPPPLIRRTPQPSSVSQKYPEMAFISEGYVNLGSNEGGDAEKPVHRVLIPAFFIDRYEVTNEEFKKFCDATGNEPPPSWKNGTYSPGTERHPVVGVSWSDARAFASWAGKRLPTEAEWERAAKGPHAFQYSYGNGYDAGKANTAQGKTTPVGSFSPSLWELYDMTGNVNEWTSSLLKPYPYQKDDGREDPDAEGPRVLRGGSHSSGQENSRCFVRLGSSPDQGGPSDGFRCARDAR
ncbi:MAG: SUMF1/EgtB/PvdO family nonheme iron enzyme [Acidobacteriota bacterium]